MRTAGWIPAARSRSSSTAARALSKAWSTRPRARPGVALPALAGELQLEHQRDEPLLGAVVEVAAEAPPLGVAGLDDPRARGAQRLEPGAQLGLEAGVLERERGGAGRRAQQFGLLGQLRVVDERRDDPAVVDHLGGRPPARPRTRRDHDRPAGPVDEALAVLEPVGDEQ